jgi:hypothetical protein
MKDLIKKIRAAKRNPEEQYRLAFFGKPVTPIEEALYNYLLRRETDDRGEPSIARDDFLQRVDEAVRNRDFGAFRTVAWMIERPGMICHHHDKWRAALASFKLSFWDHKRRKYRGPVLSCRELAGKLGYDRTDDLRMWQRMVKDVGIPYSKVRGRPIYYHRSPKPEFAWKSE